MITRAGTGSDFSGLTDYLVNRNEERVSYIGGRNLLREDPSWALVQMRDTAAMSERTEKPVYHLSVSFPVEDQTTREERLWAMRELLDDLGLTEHQVLFVEHEDTDHSHTHAMINRVHPREGTAWSTSYDWKQIEETERRIEKQKGWTQVAGFHARPEGARKPAPALSDQEAQRKKTDGTLPFARRLEKQVGGRFENAQTWKDLEESLLEEGLKLKMTGRGGVVTDGEEVAKLSAIALRFSGPRLEERFGESYREYLGRYAGRQQREKGEIETGRHGSKRLLQAGGSLFQEAGSSAETGSSKKTDSSQTEDFSQEAAEAREVRNAAIHVGKAWAAAEKGRARETAARMEETIRAWSEMSPEQRRSLRDALTEEGNMRLDEALRRTGRGHPGSRRPESRRPESRREATDENTDEKMSSGDGPESRDLGSRDLESRDLGSRSIGSRGENLLWKTVSEESPRRESPREKMYNRQREVWMLLRRLGRAEGTFGETPLGEATFAAPDGLEARDRSVTDRGATGSEVAGKIDGLSEESEQALVEQLTDREKEVLKQTQRKDRREDRQEDQQEEKPSQERTRGKGRDRERGRGGGRSR
jgi:hypothetical protein